jgi:hypothetical protein
MMSAGKPQDSGAAVITGPTDAIATSSRNASITRASILGEPPRYNVVQFDRSPFDHRHRGCHDDSTSLTVSEACGATIDYSPLRATKTTTPSRRRSFNAFSVALCTRLLPALQLQTVATFCNEDLRPDP